MKLQPFTESNEMGAAANRIVIMHFYDICVPNRGHDIPIICQKGKK